MTINQNHLEGSLILLVEDNLTLQRNAAFLLRVAGFNVVTVSSGAEALNFMKSQSPDLILSDVDMPGMNGFDLLRQVRAEKTLWHLPFILTSANYAYDDLMQALDLGASEFLPKPYDVYDLIDAVCMALDVQIPFKAAG